MVGFFMFQTIAYACQITGGPLTSFCNAGSEIREDENPQVHIILICEEEGDENSGPCYLPIDN